jgi:hypothetical protein
LANRKDLDNIRGKDADFNKMGIVPFSHYFKKRGTASFSEY